MYIRPATREDLERCLELDDWFDTEYVWQMEQKGEPTHVSSEFRLTRLPRAMHVTNGIYRDLVTESFEHGGMLLVAEDTQPKAFIQFHASDWNSTLNINAVVVTSKERGRGLGSRLLNAALVWGKQNKLRSASATTFTKNYPAISFLQKNGFVFCGFDEWIYPNRDIALTFAMALK